MYLDFASSSSSAVPKIESYSGQDQATVVSNAPIDWNFNDKVQITISTVISNDSNHKIQQKLSALHKDVHK